MLQSIIDFLVWIIWDFGYIGIFLMMTLESSFFIPFPSEIAMIPAWYLISTWEMNFYIAFAAWTLWALLWAIINYALWYYFWWKIVKILIKKYWKYIFLNPTHYEKAELFFKKHWTIATFTWRLITIVRQYISLPAWVFKMNFAKFILYTGLWAWLWNLILIWIWYTAWENKELIAKYSKEISIFLLVFIIAILFIYLSLGKLKKGK